MIDITNENLVSFGDVPRLLPTGPNGRRVHIAAVYRWAQKGLQGVRLEFAKLGGRRYTSREALQRFSDRLTASRQEGNSSTRPADARQRAAEAAAMKAAEILGGDRRATA